MPDASQADFLICAKTPSFKHAIYCCPNINNAIEQHFRTYSTKSKEHPPCANMMSSEFRGMLFRGWFVRHEPEAHPPCANITSAPLWSMAHPPCADMISWARRGWLVRHEPQAHLSCADMESSAFRGWFVRYESIAHPPCADWCQRWANGESSVCDYDIMSQSCFCWICSKMLSKRIIDDWTAMYCMFKWVVFLGNSKNRLQKH